MLVGKLLEVVVPATTTLKAESAATPAVVSDAVAAQVGGEHNRGPGRVQLGDENIGGHGQRGLKCRRRSRGRAAPPGNLPK